MEKTAAFFFICQLALFANAQIHVGPGQTYASIYNVCTAHAAHPGDTIYMHAGVYTDHGQVFDSLIGTPSQWILIRPWHNDSVSIHVQYTFQYAQYLKLYGLNFYGNDSAQSANVYHILFFDYNYACFTANHNIIVDNCKFTELNNTGKLNSGAMLKLDGTDNFQVSNCLFKDAINTADGISCNADINGLISHCRFENQPDNGSHCKGGAKNIIYQQNIFINCSINGIDVGGDTGPAYFCPLGASWEADSISVFSNIFIGGKTGVRLSSCHDSWIYNNTNFKTNQFAFRSLNASSNGIYLNNNYIYNNIFSTYSAYQLYMNASASYNYNTEYFKNNLFHDYLNPDPTSINWSEMPGVNVSGSFIGDPLFNDTLNCDFSLKQGSPAIGTGYTITDPVYDYNGNSFQSPRSIGALEYTGNLAIKDYEDANDVLVFPNPSSGVFHISWSGVGCVKSVILYNAIGQKVYSESPSGYSAVINANALPKGIYKAVIISGKGSIFSKTILID